MPDFNSPLGRRTFVNQSTQKILTVPNTEGEMSPEEERASQLDIENFQQARQERISSSRRITPESRDRIELLTGLGRLEDTVEFEGVKFHIQSLKSGAKKAIAASGFGATRPIDAYYISRNETLARCIYAIDGQPLHLVLGTSDLASIVQWVEEMDDNVMELIHDRYLKMLKDNKNKYEVNTPEEVQKVVEEIKK